MIGFRHVMTGLRAGLVSGLLGGYDQFNGGRANHRLTPEIVNHYIDEVVPA